MVIFYKKWKKYNETQLTRNKMDLNIQKMTNHPPSLGPSPVKLALKKVVPKEYFDLFGNVTFIITSS